MTPAIALPDPMQSAGMPAAAPPLLAAGLWALTLSTLTPLDREDEINSVGSLDLIALVKLAIRLAALVGLGYLLLTHWNNRDRRRATWLFAPLALFLGWALLSTLWSPLKSVSLGQAISLMTLCWLSAAIVIIDRGEATSQQLIRHAAHAALAFSSLMLAMIAINGGVDDRFGFYLAHPTAVGGSASLGLILLLAGRFIWEWDWARQWLLPGSAIHGTAILLAYNRTALAAAVIVSGVLLLAYADRIVLAVGGVLGSMALLTVAAVDPSWQWLVSGVQSSGEYVSREQSWDQLLAFSGREELWTLIWDSFRESPWIGHGYFVTTREGILSVWYREANFHAHNLLLQALASTGLIGAALLAWALGRPLLFAVGQLYGGDEVARRSGLFVLVFLWLMIWGLCDVAILGPVAPFVVVFFLSLGLLAGATQLQQGEQDAPLPSAGGHL